MKPIRDKESYFRVLNDFVTRRTSAAVFMPRFRHLWQSEGAEEARNVRAKIESVGKSAGLLVLLGFIDSLCEDYAHNLPDGVGYRVSEEEFRNEVRSRTSALPLARSEERREHVPNLQVSTRSRTSQDV